MLLSSFLGFLRQACIRSHPNSSHPFQCRALELCFSVALEHSWSLSSAPKRIRGEGDGRASASEAKVMVELEQLIISILADPSVSRVMREASFPSHAVKATIEQSLNSNAHAKLVLEM
ncbi:Double Clp-N motif-containing P-loop nucleoside triphosphate hydrolase superfamily protein [Abeliophyllum distichum]|uniref:Double Clp-N motif-containing P-loop nucleoside triphosphate hydrolase superfamily protein n=1 Tax=Abeliophyllum distichum TaxID=126358 RepID=A0ABD1VVP2_9LAMI